MKPRTVADTDTPAPEDAAARYRAEVRRNADALAELRAENGELRKRIGELAEALRSLTTELAETRHAHHLQELEIAVLRARPATPSGDGRGTPTR